MTSTPLARGARPFRVRAEDGEDLTIAAAHLQDAVATVGDVAFLPDERRFAMVVSRFRWETGTIDRVHTAVVVNAVSAVRRRGISLDRPEALLNLLTIEAGEGHIDLVFSGRATIRLVTDRIDCVFEDVGETWPTMFRPAHALE